MNEEVQYKHTDDMGEISGFGGGYEDVCQQMLHNGVKFLSERSGTDVRVLERARASSALSNWKARMRKLWKKQSWTGSTMQLVRCIMPL